jgi:hypothetical protein
MDRFELEDKIIAMNNVNEELEVLSRRVLDEDLDQDDIVNAINGIVILQSGRQNQLWDTFINAFSLDQYSGLDNDTCGYSEDTNPSVDLDFNGVRSCCRKSCGND